MAAHYLLEELARLQLSGSGKPIELRRWSHGEFEILYAVASDVVVILSARDQRQQDFR